MSLKDLIIYADDEACAAITEAVEGSTSAFLHFSPKAFARRLHACGYVVVRTQDVIAMTRDDIIRQLLADMPERLKQAGQQLVAAYQKPASPAQEREP